MPMEQDEYAVFLRALTTLVRKLDERFDAQEEFNRQQVLINDRMAAGFERVTVAIARIGLAIERIDVTLEAIKDLLERGTDH
jgi:hypothetical protein